MIATEQLDRIKQDAMALSGLAAAPTSLDLHAKVVVTETLAMCNREDIPETMELIVTSYLAKMLAFLYSTSPGAVKSITRGDTSIGYEVAAFKDSEAVGYGKLLKKFTKLGVIR